MKLSLFALAWTNNWCGQISTKDSFVTVHKTNEYIYPLYNALFLDALVIGKTSPNSHTARTELRECENKKPVYWNSKTPKKLKVKLAVISLPKIVKSTAISQIKFKEHGAAMMVFLLNKRIYVKTDKTKITLDDDYNLGNVLELEYKVCSGNVSVKYRNGKTFKRISYITAPFENAYFKIGNYVQSKAPPETANYKTRVIIYDAVLS
jgi:hypothetical protein